jgi:hypothetical protein
MKIASALLACTALATPAGAWNLDDLNRRADENLVQVGDGCSGTLVNVEHRLIFTAYHCIGDHISTKTETKRDADSEPLVGGDGKPITETKKTLTDVPIHQFFMDADGKMGEIEFWAKIVARDALLDVAILQVPAKVGPVMVAIAATSDVPLAAADFVAQRGSTIWHIGNPKMMYGTATRGVMSSKRSLSEYGFDRTKYFIQYDGGIAGGSSGGALYSDDGVFLGITTLGMPAVTFLGYAVPMSDVWKVADAACLSTDLGGVNPPKCPNATKKVEPINSVRPFSNKP